ncbi:hypothetical protein J8L98_17435 [Pseudoalteromonas sp. MMG013]|uniref:hypothetical protein n=1 Tax=Pseudoalteromonas sp. MMG013 TaxID=2822687 RepID=UPI001B36737F|nr:hypothetical protein [Pseudoalteromonas sp. MMG013]MBQ4863469.1 hypothetical protein [Pseudoalteromonas sp. MMG013]
MKTAFNNEVASPIQRQAMNESVNGISNRWSAACEQATGYNPQSLGYSMNITSPNDSYLTSIGARSAIQGSSITIGHTADIPHELGHIPDRVEGKVKADTVIAGQAVCTDQTLEARADSYGDAIKSAYDRLG